MNAQTDSNVVNLFGKKPIISTVIFLSKNKFHDFSKLEIAKGIGVSRLTLYKHFKTIEDFGLVKMTRKFGKTKLYAINDKSEIVNQIVVNSVQVKRDLLQDKELKTLSELNYLDDAYQCQDGGIIVDQGGVEGKIKQMVVRWIKELNNFKENECPNKPSHIIIRSFTGEPYDVDVSKQIDSIIKALTHIFNITKWDFELYGQ